MKITLINLAQSKALIVGINKILRIELKALARKFVFLLAVVSLFYCAGCSHIRYGGMVTVEDLGLQIATKNKYKLVQIKYDEASRTGDFNENKLTEQERIYLNKTNGILKSAQPQVFGDDGIPFVLSWNTFPIKENKGFQILIHTLVLPGLLTIEGTVDYSVDVLDNPKAHATFKYYSGYNYAMTLLPVPTSCLCFLGDLSFKSKPKESRTFTHHKMGFGEMGVM